MARLHQYDANSSKSGYHLKGWTKHSGNTTLQVRYPCELLFDWIDFEPGDRIPSDLITSLLGANLLYTVSDGSAIEEDLEWTPSLDTISEELTDSQRQRLLGFIREYDGPRHKFIEQLESEVDTGEGIPGDARLSSYTSAQQNWHACIDSTSRGADESLHQIANQVFGAGSLTDETASIIQEWNSDSDLESFTEAPHVESSVRLFNDYVGTVHSVDTAEDTLVYFVTLPEADQEDPWPKFVVNHFPNDIMADEDEDYDLVFKVQIPDNETDSLPIVDENETIVHQIIVLDGDAIYWSVRLLDSSFESDDAVQEALHSYLERVFHCTSELMEYLIGETIGESIDDVAIEFKTGHPE